MNFTLSGSGTLTGGEYEKVTLSGSIKLSGEVRCTSLRASGSFGGRGSIDCSDKMSLSGSAHIDGALTGKSIHSAGALKCAEIKGESVALFGAASIDGDVEAEDFRLKGAVRCGGLINADMVDMLIDGASCAQSIGGSSISIKPSAAKKGLLGRIFKLGDRGELRVDEGIEGDDIRVENVIAKHITGKNVSVGRGSRIVSVQYSENIEISPEAIVEHIEQI